MSLSLLDFDTWPAGIASASIPANNNARRAEVLAGPVISASTTAQPVGPAERDIYIIPASATGTQWATFDEGDLAIYYDATWTAYAPYNGLIKFVLDEGTDGENWQRVDGAWAAMASGGGVPGGSDTQVQFNDAGSFGGDAGLVYNKTTDTLGVVNATLTGLALTAASGTGSAGLRAPHGIAPSSPVDGDMWTTTTGVYARINGATVGPLGAAAAAGSSNYVQYNAGGAFGAEAAFAYDPSTNTLTVDKITMNGLMLTLASATGGSGFRLPHGAAPTSPVDGDVWTTSAGGMYVRINGVTVGPLAAGGGGSLTNWTEAVNTSAPNATVPVVSWAPNNAATNADSVVASKGSGSLARQVADNTTTGGNKRGLRAFDMQAARSAASQVASGSDSVALGSGGTASGNNSVTIGRSNQGTAADAIAIGALSQATAANALALGNTSTASAADATALAGGTADGISSIAAGTGAAVRGVTGMESIGIASGTNRNKLTLYRSTTNTTPVVLTSAGGVAAAAANQFRMTTNNNQTQGFWGYVVARQTGSGNPQAMWKFEGLMSRDGGTISLIGVTGLSSPITSFGTITGWAVAVTVSSGTNSLVVTVTGPSGVTVNWTCVVESTEAAG